MFKIAPLYKTVTVEERNHLARDSLLNSEFIGGQQVQDLEPEVSTIKKRVVESLDFTNFIFGGELKKHGDSQTFFRK